jgi:hypothetical protein
MNNNHYKIEKSTLFSESLIWELGRNYYDEAGVDAWRKGTVPHHMTSNAMVGKTYAELVFSFLKDLAHKGQTHEKVYILELGAGHGRLAFHILKHLTLLTDNYPLPLAPYCYILSDIIEDSLNFFSEHLQFQPYYTQGVLDVAYFDAVETKAIYLRHAGITINPNSLKQPLLALANYFFDSIPKDLFYFNNKNISVCSVALETAQDPATMDNVALIDQLELAYQLRPLNTSFYQEELFNTLIEDYRNLVFNTFLFFPKKGLQCLSNLRQLSQQGLMLLSMDKGFHKVHDLEHTKAPELVTHGSLSFSVNYHAYGAYCKKHHGTTLFPSYATLNLQLVCLLFVPDSDSYFETQAAYQRFVNDFGPDDFNVIKQFTYKHIAKMSLPELISYLRLSAYDSTLFTTLLPRLKQLIGQITFNERARLAQTMHKTWNTYFTLNESNDLAFELAGIFYALGLYQDALTYFEHSSKLFGYTADGYYNTILCYYQLRKDQLFTNTLQTAKASFPSFENFTHLENLDLNAV